MKQLFVMVLIQMMMSCGTDNQSKPTPAETAVQKPGFKNENTVSYAVDLQDLTKDWMTWYTYQYRTIRLAQDFIGLNTDSSRIDKNAFLTRLKTGNFIPLQIMEQNGVSVYKLSRFSDDPEIRRTMKEMAAFEMENYKMEGKTFSDFDFKDLNGKEYNNKNTKGKILVLKCWFIHCAACVAEFRDLNKLVDEYKRNKDVVFVSLALDSPGELRAFLEKKPFKYAVVADKQDFMDAWKIQAYPTHLLIKDGKILKVTNEIADLIPFIKRETVASL